MPSLLNKRLIIVTGKGGVGKSTVAATLGMAAAGRGLRTIICEVAQQKRMSRFFHREGIGYRESELADGLYAISIDPDRSMEEYLRLQIKIKPVADLLFSNRIFHYFAAATPGMKELVTIGKAWELAQLDRKVKKAPKYDLVIVDAPATGHGLGMLKTPKMFADVARVGPIKRQGDAIHNFISDSRVTGVVAVCLPEEMPVNETLDLERDLTTELGLKLDIIFMNGLYRRRFKKAEVELMQKRYGESDNGKATAEKMVMKAALRAALSQAARAKLQGRQLNRLKKETKAKVAELPFLFQTEFDTEHFDALSRAIEGTL